MTDTLTRYLIKAKKGGKKSPFKKTSTKTKTKPSTPPVRPKKKKTKLDTIIDLKMGVQALSKFPIKDFDGADLSSLQELATRLATIMDSINVDDTNG